MWLFDILQDEQNIHRDRVVVPYNSQDEEHRRSLDRMIAEDIQLPITQNCRNAYENALKYNNSPFIKLVGSQLMNQSTCSSCGHSALNKEPLGNMIVLTLLEAKGKRQSLDSLLQSECELAPLEAAQCDECKARDTRSRKILFSHLPDYLVFQLKKAQGGVLGRSVNNVQVDFPEVLDMAKYTWLSTEDEFSERVLPEQKPPFLYDCYAVIQHRGSPSSGHYWTLSRRVDKHNRWTSEWHEFSDSIVNPGKTFAHTQSINSVVMLYRRQGRD